MTPENTFRKRIHDKLVGTGIYHEKSHNIYHSGTPDDYYEGEECMFWVEYKYIKRVPVRAFSVKLSELQKRWLYRNWINGHSPLVIVGHPRGGYILDHPDAWTGQQRTAKHRSYTVAEIVQFLRRRGHEGA